MVALRRRSREQPTELIAPQMGDQSAAAAAHAAVNEERQPVFAVTPVAAPPPPPAPPEPPLAEQPEPDLKARFAALEAAERVQREHFAQVQAEIAANMARQQQPEPQGEVDQQQIFEAMIRDYPEPAKERFRAHPEYVINPRMTAKLVAAHWDALDAGHEQYTPSYFQYLDERVFDPPTLTIIEDGRPYRDMQTGEKVPAHVVQRKPKPRPALATEPRETMQEHEQPSAEHRRAAAMTSAPPHRDVPSYSTGRPENGRVRLTPTELEIAKSSGLTAVEYAEQKLRLQREKASDPERFRDR